MTVGRNLTEDQKAQIRRLFLRGLRPETIRIDMGLNITTVRNQLYRSGLWKRPKYYWTDEDLGIVKAMIAEGCHTYRAIGLAIGRKADSVKSKVYELGLHTARTEARDQARGRPTRQQPDSVAAPSVEKEQAFLSSLMAQGGFPALSERFVRMVRHQREMVACLPLTYPAQAFQRVA